MIKKFTCILLAALSMGLTANADDTTTNDITLNYAHMLESTASTGLQPITSCASSDNLYFVLSTWGSSTDGASLYQDGKAVTGLDGEAIVGSPSEGNSTNANLLLQKINPSDGSINWFVYTRKGDMAESSYNHVLPTSDGGAVVVVKTRAWKAVAGLDNLLEVVDGKGYVTTIKDMTTEQSEYRYLVMRFDGDGKLSWSRLITGLVHQAGESDYKYATKNNCYVYGATLDANENIYLTGNLRTEMHFKKADGTTVTLTAKNNTGWNGDSQKVIGDLFLAKLDKNGYCDTCLVAEGTAECSFLDRIVYNDGKLYVNGRIKGNGTDISLGGKALTVSSTMQTMLVASINTTDLTVNYANTLMPVAGTGTSSFVVQNKNLQYIDGALYLTGGLKGNLQQDGIDVFAAKTTSNTGYLLKIDAATGKALSGLTMSATYNQFGVFVKNDSLYSYGDAILYTIDPAKFEQTNKRSIVKNFGMNMACTSPVVYGNDVLFTTRGKKASKDIAFYNNTDYAAPTWATTNWVLNIFSYKFPSAASGINSAKSDTAVDSYDVYTPAGVLVKHASSLKEAKSGLPAGLYVIGNEKVTVE